MRNLVQKILLIAMVMNSFFSFFLIPMKKFFLHSLAGVPGYVCRHKDWRSVSDDPEVQ